MFIVPNAADVARSAPDLSTGGCTNPRALDPVIGFIGSFYSYEGLDLLVKAARDLVQLLPKIRFLLVGGGPEEASLREFCRTSGLNGCMSCGLGAARSHR